MICMCNVIYNIHICSGLPRWLSGERICLPMQEIQVMWVDPWIRKTTLEKEMGTHSSNLAWKISWTEEPGGLQSRGSKLDTTEVTWHACSHTLFSCSCKTRDTKWRSKFTGSFDLPLTVPAMRAAESCCIVRVWRRLSSKISPWDGSTSNRQKAKVPLSVSFK